MDSVKDTAELDKFIDKIKLRLVESNIVLVIRFLITFFSSQSNGSYEFATVTVAFLQDYLNNVKWDNFRLVLQAMR